MIESLVSSKISSLDREKEPRDLPDQKINIFKNYNQINTLVSRERDKITHSSTAPAAPLRMVASFHE